MDNGLLGRLKNRGLVPLSADNPYLAANLLVSKEMDKSEELRGFVQHRGAPAAIEVEKGTFSALVMKFYYPERDEYYSLEDVENTWIISGPFTIPASDLGKVAVYTRKTAMTPRLAREEQSLPAGVPPLPAADTQQTVAAPSKPQGFQSPPLPEFHAPQPVSGAPSTARETEVSDEATLIRKIAASSPQTAAEITPRGDVVHYVTYPGETLSIISRWYTETRDNAGRLARINELKNPDRLALGDQIVIPAYLVKNKHRLSREAIESLRALSPER